MIEPEHPFQGCQFHGRFGFPWGASANELCFIKAVDRCGESILLIYPFSDQYSNFPAVWIFFLF